MKRIDTVHGATIEGEITVEDYIAKAPAVPSPTWVSKDELGSTRMLGYVLAIIAVVAIFTLRAVIQ